MKRRIVINGPCYKNELLIYQKETLDKIDGFRRARTHWLATADESQKASTKVKEGMNESNIYKGRCSCLRRIKLKTDLLRVRYKNFRPERYWTFRKKLTEQDMERYDALERGEIAPKPKRQLSRLVCSSSDIWKKGDLEACYQEAAKIKGRLPRKQKKRECKEMEASGPCKKAIKRLKASKIKDGIIESCKCDDGREVTVVIKGICLCDKTNLGKVNLSKVCDEYSKMQKPPGPPAEGASEDAEKKTKETKASDPNPETELQSDKFLHVNDSEETYRRSLHEMKDKKPNEKDTVEESHDNATETNKKLTFLNEENLKGDGGKRFTNPSDLTLFRKFSSDSDIDTAVKPKTEPPVSRLLPVKNPLKQDDPVLGVSKPVEVPQSDSMNNLLVNDDGITGTKGQLKKDPVTPNKKPSELTHASNSLEIYKKQWKKHAHKQEEPDKTEEPQEDLEGNKKQEKTTEKKAKVRLIKNPTVIPPSHFPAEETPSPQPETKSAGTSLETHDLLTHEKSGKEKETEDKVEEKESESKSKASVDNRQTPEVNHDEDDKSIVTLYKNEPEQKSEMGLTKEEYERMEEVKKEEQHEKSLEKTAQA